MYPGIQLPYNCSDTRATAVAAEDVGVPDVAVAVAVLAVVVAPAAVPAVVFVDADKVVLTVVVSAADVVVAAADVVVAAAAVVVAAAVFAVAAAAFCLLSLPENKKK